MNFIYENKKNIMKQIKKPIHIKIKRNYNAILGKKSGKITFFEGTTNQAICEYHKIKKSCCVLNFANSHIVGGGDLSCYTQEEELCKTIAELYSSLKLLADKQNRYTNFKWWSSVYYSDNLTMVRHDHTQSYNLLNIPIHVSVITSAMPNLRSVKSQTNIMLNNSDIMFKQIENIIITICLTQIICNKHSDILILGAFGCGDFCLSEDNQNKLKIRYSEEIAKIFKKVIDKYKILSYYDEICFAIPSGNNYDAFRKILGD